MKEQYKALFPRQVNNEITFYEKFDFLYQKFCGPDFIKNRTNIDQFQVCFNEKDPLSHIYALKNIARDKLDIQNYLDLRNAKEKENPGNYNLSNLSEALMVDLMNKWFFELNVIISSFYDDVKSGVDALCVGEKKQDMGMSFDFTLVEGDIDNLLKKLSHQVNEVKRGSITTVKYFKHPITNNLGKVVAPKFIIGIRKIDMSFFIDNYYLNNQQKLDETYIKYILIMQIEIQLDYYISLIKKKVKNGEKIYNKKLDFFSNIKDDLLKKMKKQSNYQDKMLELDFIRFSENYLPLTVLKTFFERLRES